MKCPLCEEEFGGFKCPHDWGHVNDWNDKQRAEERVREIVQQELKKHKCPCQTPLDMVVS